MKNLELRYIDNRPILHTVTVCGVGTVVRNYKRNKSKFETALLIISGLARYKIRYLLI